MNLKGIVLVATALFANMRVCLDEVFERVA